MRLYTTRRMVKLSPTAAVDTMIEDFFEGRIDQAAVIRDLKSLVRERSATIEMVMNGLAIYGIESRAIIVQICAGAQRVCALVETYPVPYTARGEDISLMHGDLWQASNVSSESIEVGRAVVA